MGLVAASLPPSSEVCLLCPLGQVPWPEALLALPGDSKAGRRHTRIASPASWRMALASAIYYLRSSLPFGCKWQRTRDKFRQT